MLSNSYDLCGCMVSCKRSLWINKIRVAILLSAEFRRRIVATFSMEFCTKEFHLPRSNNTHSRAFIPSHQELPKTMQPLQPLQPFEATPSCTGARFAPWSIPWSAAPAKCRRGCRGSWEDSNSSCMSCEAKPKCCGKT